MSEKSTTQGRGGGMEAGGGKDEAKWRRGSRKNESERGNAEKESERDLCTEHRVGEG